MQAGVPGADRAQPAEEDRPRLDRLPGQVEVPLAVVVGVKTLDVEAADRARDRAARATGAEPVDHGGAEGPHRQTALHVQPRRVEHHPGQVGLPLVGPQRDDEAAGGVRADDHVVVPVTLDDPLPGSVEVGEVLVQVSDVVGGLVRADRPAVLAQVEGVEVVAAVGPPLGVRGLEEVVGEAVHVEHGPAGGLPARRTTSVATTGPSSSGGRPIVSARYGAPRTSGTSSSKAPVVMDEVLRAAADPQCQLGLVRGHQPGPARSQPVREGLLGVDRPHQQRQPCGAGRTGRRRAGASQWCATTTLARDCR